MNQMSRMKSMNRFQAAGLHFLASASVLLLIFALVRWVWYPGPLFTVAGGINIIGILTAVDVVLGPLIMLIIFNPQKKSLKFDIACVLVFQIAAMGYGSWTVIQARPAFVALVDDKFKLVTANEIEEDDLKKASLPAFKSIPLGGPMVVGTQMPSDPKQVEAVLFAGTAGLGLQNLPQNYLPYDKVLEQAKQAARPVGAMNRLSKEERQFLEQYEAAHPGRKTGFVLTLGKQRRMFAVIDLVSGALLEIILP